MLKVQNISFSYQDQVTLEQISFHLEKGKALAIIGESGCGKSTLLKLIYGLHDLKEGLIYWNEHQVLGPKFHLIPGMEYMKYLAQDFDLMPYITVAENVGKYLSNIFPEEKKNRIHELLSLVEMEDFATVKAKNLSGGQMQRVALARVLALEPQVLLLDEPFSHIDNFRKNSLRRKLFTYLKEKQITTVFATHDSSDVLSFAEDVLVLKNGKVVEFGSTPLIYKCQKNKYIASLFGEINEIEINGKTELIYSHQLKLAEQSTIQVQVKASYFKGNNYLIEAIHNGTSIFFENEKSISKNTFVYLQKSL